MKALILAAGLGTRLRPFSDHRPKPLFPIAGRPLLDILIDRLVQAGCRAVMVNTHHQHRQIEAFLASQSYPVPVLTRYEPTILGTGGAIKNVDDFWDAAPFMVVNGDITTDVDFAAVYAFHLSHRHPATLVLYDDPEFNTVAVNVAGDIVAFDYQPPVPAPEARPEPAPLQALTFTGIQVLDPAILELIPGKVFAGSIEAFSRLLSRGAKIKAYVPPRGAYWKDIGTPQRYQQAAGDQMAPTAFEQAYPGHGRQPLTRVALQGDGSDRRWLRLASGGRSLILAEHPIRAGIAVNETEAFVRIGRHLLRHGLPVPEIYLYDTFSGHVFMQDLGDVNLQHVVQAATATAAILAHYQMVIDLLVDLCLRGAEGFDPAWTCQTPAYDRDMILEKECRYFVEAFLNGYLERDDRFASLADDFVFLATQAVACGVTGFMHRDMQSRNIMVFKDRHYFIDFQGGRLGPLQYDLASLLIDPYVNLAPSLQAQLYAYAADRLAGRIEIDIHKFERGYAYCSLSRNLQILGAFGYLSRVKGKPYFAAYIPAALATLKYNLARIRDPQLSALKRLAAGL